MTTNNTKSNSEITNNVDGGAAVSVQGRVFQQGERVMANFKPGTIAYVRFDTEFRPACYSVIMDHRRSDPSYTGTIWPACDIREMGVQHV